MSSRSTSSMRSRALVSLRWGVSIGSFGAVLGPVTRVHASRGGPLESWASFSSQVECPRGAAERMEAIGREAVRSMPRVKAAIGEQVMHECVSARRPGQFSPDAIRWNPGSATFSSTKPAVLRPAGAITAAAPASSVPFSDRPSRPRAPRIRARRR